MVYHVKQCGEAPVVVEATLHVRPKAIQRSGPVTMVRCAIRFEVVDAYLAALVQVPSRFAPDRFGMAGRALGFPAEQLVASFGSLFIKTAFWRLWCRDC